MANKTKNQTKMPANNNQEVSKELTTYGYDQEVGADFAVKPSDQAAKKKPQNPQS
jgi:hypothetical protein